jgi:uncharacterized membrane protein YukC
MEYKFNGKMSFDDYVQFNKNLMIEHFFQNKVSLAGVSETKQTKSRKNSRGGTFMA